ncbi:Ig-like domain-containing protein [Microbacterium sp. QXD-8]|uniref:Ig-like domain-containing protein n=1 Tax=Microbacterium psychrotolerans TaxID=3068321 RepID=A0ABU0Z0A7_9MICO|nr:Ig-like domain-containing protein [Microbacterium sp. QXD-8]MDQ7877226.1 Ig-like domain-containing protein [Microbacterium sp. QXD-8]
MPTPAPPPGPTTPAPEPTTPTTPAPTPTTPSPPVQTASPALDTPRNLSAAIPAPITGAGTPGASVALVDESGSELVTVTAGADGRFSATIPGDLLHTGMTVRAVQTVTAMRPSEPSAPVGPFLLPAPTVTAADGSLDARLEDADRDGLADDLYLQLSGEQGRTVAVSVDGAWTGNLHVLTGPPLLRVVYDMAPGAHAIGIRYVDPATGREGRVAHVTIDATAR